MLATEWHQKKLEEICTLITDGTHITPKYIEKGIPFISTANLVPYKENFDFSKYRKFISLNEHKQLTARAKPEKGDILVSKCGTIGRTQEVKVDYDFSIFVGLMLLKIRKDLVLPSYLEFYLNQPVVTHALKKLAVGSSRATLTIKDMKQFKINLPTLETQLHIVEALKKTEQLREWREQSDELTKELLTNIFLKMFGDPIVNTKKWLTIPLEDLSKRKITYGIVQPGNEVPNGVPIVRSIDLKDDLLLVTGLKRISSDIDAKSFRSRLKGGELLISVRGKIGPVAIAEQGLANSNVSRGVALLEPNDKVKVEYLFGVFTIPSFRNRLDQNARGIALRQLNLNILRATKIPVPPLKLQEKYGNLFNEIRKVQSNQDRAKEQIQIFYEKILKNYFRRA